MDSSRDESHSSTASCQALCWATEIQLEGAQHGPHWAEHLPRGEADNDTWTHMSEDFRQGLSAIKKWTGWCHWKWLRKVLTQLGTRGRPIQGMAFWLRSKWCKGTSPTEPSRAFQASVKIVQSSPLDPIYFLKWWFWPLCGEWTVWHEARKLLQWSRKNWMVAGPEQQWWWRKTDGPEAFCFPNRDTWCGDRSKNCEAGQPSFGSATFYLP